MSMKQPIALKLSAESPPEVYRVGIDPALASQLKAIGHHSGPAVIVSRKVAVLAEPKLTRLAEETISAVRRAG